MPGDSMDLFIATNVMSGQVLPYSTDLNAAWSVWQKMVDKFQVVIFGNSRRTEIGQVFTSKEPEVIAESHSPAHAICLAATKLLVS